ncbi:MAG TPA: DNA-directed DNA polymerase [Candidatus Methanofastidiosa archaeon]|nr:DNA-directed DNA polymerase [Candidatus Methanofastidiosa archaeon]
MIIFDCDYVAMNDRTTVRLFVKDNDSCMTIYDDSHTPYIYAIPKVNDAERVILDLVKVNKETVVKVKDIERVEMRLKGKRVDCLKVFFHYPFHVPELRDDISKYADIFEYDILYTRRYLMDKGIPLLKPLEIETEERDGRRYLRSFKEIEGKAEGLSVLSLDIETYCNRKGSMSDPSEDPIIMISAANAEGSHVFTWKECPNSIFCPDEKSMLEAFFDFLDKAAPQIIVTYNGDNFDLPYIRKRCSVLAVSHRFVNEMRIKGRGNSNSAEIPGIVHIGLFPIVKKTVNLSRYKLEVVYKEYMGKDKSDIDGAEIWRYWEDPSLREELVCYSKEDAVATYEIGEQFVPLGVEMTKIVNQRPFDVARASSSLLVEMLLMKKCQEKGEIIPNPPGSSELAKRYNDTYEGAYVVEPVKGIHDNIFYFDFRSLYPSIIIGHNVDISTLDCECCKDNMAPTGHCFCRNVEGFIPHILETLLNERIRIKSEMKNSSGMRYESLYSQQWALKILANSFYGYLGYPRSRWYSKESAESITAWGRQYINKVIGIARERGMEVVYGDTDSLFVKSKGKDMEKAREFLDFVNDNLPESMELEMEGFYKRGVFVTKKKYALIDEDGKITTKGLEVVRRDWTGIAKKTQRKVLEMLLKEGDIKGAIKYVQNVTKDIKENNVPIEDLIIDTQLTMGLSQYKAIGPHVQIAKMLKDRGEDIKMGTIVSFIVLKGSGRIRDRVVPASDYADDKIDTDYYIKNQVIPAVARILKPLGYNEDDLEYQKTSQSNLDNWF